MSVPVFGVGPAALRGLAVGATVVLDGVEGHHAADVRRLRVGEAVLVTDGRGTSAPGVAVAVARGRVDIRVEALHAEPAPSPRLVVVQALAKGDRGETAVETLTEVGVDLIVPWAAGRSVAQWSGERLAKGLDRWRSTAREAAKQSRRTWWPEVSDLASTDEVAARLAGAALGVVLHEGAEIPLAGLVVAPTGGDVVVVVGPEGGITNEEIAAFAAAGATAHRLGPTVLRTSTAGTAAAAVLLAACGRWG